MNSIQNNFVKHHGMFLGNSTFVEAPPAAPKTETDQMSAINEKKIEEVWSTHNFDTANKVKVEDIKIISSKTTWGEVNSSWNDNPVADQTSNTFEFKDEPNVQSELVIDVGEDSTQPLNERNQEDTSPAHHARRPPNAFLIFCKKHRPIVRQRYPNTENRGVTKILGEWWALLDIMERQPYNDLAKEYKDAFLLANPDFRWYKLPAPPLRTLTTRPVATISRPPQTSSIIGSPSRECSVEFTPGKLADESQLGGLSSLMKTEFNATKTIGSDGFISPETNNNNNNNDDESSEMFYQKLTPHSKSIKKRIFEEIDEDNNEMDEDTSMTQQDLLNKVVDGMFANDTDDRKEHRKSDRMCKGKLYERFMKEGKLLGNKKDTKLAQHNHRATRLDSKIEQELTMTRVPTTEGAIWPNNLESTIKRLAERTLVKLEFDDDVKCKASEPIRSSEPALDSPTSLSRPSPLGINLDSRIDNLASLCYDDFIVRKRENKKRKLKIKPDTGGKLMKREHHATKPKLIGSKKRKNKLSITHLNKDDEKLRIANNNNIINQTDGEKDEVNVTALAENPVLTSTEPLSGLATLAMVAASTEKIIGQK